MTTETEAQESGDTTSPAGVRKPGLRLVLALILIAWVSLGTYLLFTTNQQVLGVGGRDLFGHFVLFSFVAASGTAVLSEVRNKPAPVLGLVALGVIVAGASELAQGALVGNRDAQWSDFFADAAGVVAGVAFASVVPRWTPTRPGGLRIVAAWCLIGLLVAGGVVGSAAFEVSQRLACRGSVADIEVDGPARSLPGTVVFDFDGSIVQTAEGSFGPESWGTRAPSVASSGAVFDGSSVITAPASTAESIACGVFGPDEITVLVSFTPDDVEQVGPVRLFSISVGTERADVDFHVAQQADGLSVRARTSADRLFTTVIPDMLAADGQQHVIVTVADDVLWVYTSAGGFYTEEMRGSDLAGWHEDYFVTIGDEQTGDRAYRGEISRITVTNATIDESAAQGLLQNLDASG